MTKINPLDLRATNNVMYTIHKADAHNGHSSLSCSECAEFEYELMPNKTRRDSE